jgi:hypothetical protein
MQTDIHRKFKLFPYAHPYKKAGQMWSPLLKMSKARKRMFNHRNRFFSMEYRRSLPKRLFWQMTLPTLHPSTSTAGSLVMQHPWPTFRALFFGKMWMLKNPSLVPGVVWPVKSKKYLLAKIHASQALTHLVGKASQKWMKKVLQKLWALSSPTRSSLWLVAGGLDTLMNNFLLKSGVVNSLPSAYHLLTYKKLKTNGFTSNQKLAFAYPGDLIQWKDSFYLSKVLNGGPEKQAFQQQNYHPTSVHGLKVFGWLRPFYQNAILISAFRNPKKAPWKGKRPYKKAKKQVNSRSSKKFPE